MRANKIKPPDGYGIIMTVFHVDYTLPYMKADTHLFLGYPIRAIKIPNILLLEKIRCAIVGSPVRAEKQRYLVLIAKEDLSLDIYGIFSEEEVLDILRTRGVIEWE